MVHTFQGKYTFADGLEYDAEDWEYCDGYDRRFYTEICHGLKPAGTSLLLLLNAHARFGKGNSLFVIMFFLFPSRAIPAHKSYSTSRDSRRLLWLWRWFLQPCIQSSCWLWSQVSSKCRLVSKWAPSLYTVFDTKANQSQFPTHSLPLPEIVEFLQLICFTQTIYSETIIIVFHQMMMNTIGFSKHVEKAGTKMWDTGLILSSKSLQKYAIITVSPKAGGVESDRLHVQVKIMDQDEFLSCFDDHDVICNW